MIWILISFFQKGEWIVLAVMGGVMAVSAIFAWVNRER
jgi:hypothetical protein